MIQGLGSGQSTENPPFTPSGNPVWDEIQQAHSTLSPAAQRAISMSGVPQRAAQAEAAPIAGAPPAGPQAPLAPIAAPPAMKVRGLGSASSPAPSFMPLMGGEARPVDQQSPAAPNTPESARIAESNRVNAAPLPSSSPLAHTSADTGRSGIGQIHNKFLRGLARVGDVVGSTFLPNLTSMIPGTELHHRDLASHAQGAVAADTEHAKEMALTGEADARTHSLEHPAKEWKPGPEPEIDPAHPELGAQAVFYNSSDPAQKKYGNASVAAKPTQPNSALDLFLRDNPKGTAEDWAAYQEKHRAITNEFESWAANPANKGKPVSEFMKMKAENSTPKEGEMPLGERVPNINTALLNRFKILNPKASALPPEYTLPANATQKDFDRVDKILESTERAAGTKAQQDVAAEARRQTQELAQANREKKEDAGMKTAVLADHAPAADAAERFNIMAKNYEDAVKNHDQQAMLSLLTNHIGMTLGAQKGARITKDILHEAEMSRPWLQGIGAKFDKDGVLSGVVLTPPQMRQMVNLGRERFAEEVQKSRARSSFRGYAGEDPARTPSSATVNHYTALANGDPNKAKELARADGWTVE